MYLLDTDTVIDVIRKRREVAQRLSEISPEDIAISAMTVSELEFGVLRSAYSTARARDTAIFLEQVTVLPFDANAARRHALLRHELRSARIGEADLIIAATAVVSSRTLVSSNLREFGRVPGVRVESWR